MKSFLKLLLSTVAATYLAGCATIVQGTSQNIAVTTSVPGYCAFHRDGKTIATLTQTPGEVTVDKTKDDILLTCAATGYAPASQYLHSGIATGVYGNLIIGGLTGWGIDSATGADNEYPTTVSLNMYPSSDDAAAPPQPAPTPCTREQADARLLAYQEGFHFAVPCY